MKPMFKILSGTLLVALMALGLTTKADVKNDVKGLEVRDVLTEDMTKPVSGKVVRKADGEAPTAELKISAALKSQVSVETDGKRSIRFVAGIDSYLYDGASFTVSLAGTDKTWDIPVTKAYEAVVANGEEVTAAEAFGEGYNYIIAGTINNVPAEYWAGEFTAEAEVSLGEEKATGTRTVSIDELVALDSEEIEKPVEVTVVNKELGFSGVWNPHGNIFLAVGWSNGELNNDMIDTYNIVAIQDGVEKPFTFNRIDGAMAVIVQSNGLTGIETATYTLKMVLTTKPVDNVVTVYTGEVEVVNGQKYTLAKAKTDYTKELNNYLANNNLSATNYTDENWILVQGYVAAGLEAINAASTVADVKSAYATAVELINTVEQRDLSLDETIAQAKEQLAAHVAAKKQGDYTDENWTLIQNLVVEGQAAIEVAASVEEIEATLNSYKDQIDAIEVNMIALKNGNFNPHGDGFIVIGWTNAGLSNAGFGGNVVEYYGAVIIDGVEYPMQVMHDDGAMAKFFRSTKLGLTVNSADYQLVIKLTTSDGAVYGNTFTVSAGKIVGSAL